MFEVYPFGLGLKVCIYFSDERVWGAVDLSHRKVGPFGSGPLVWLLCQLQLNKCAGSTKDTVVGW